MQTKTVVAQLNLPGELRVLALNSGWAKPGLCVEGGVEQQRV